MRRAAAADARRRVHRRGARDCPIISKIAIRNLSGFADIDFAPESGMLAICGATGVGKSTLLRVISTALQPMVKGRRRPVNQRYGTLFIEMKIKSGDVEHIRSLDMRSASPADAAGFQPEFKLLSLNDRTEVLLDIFDEVDRTVAIDGSDPRLLTAEEISLVSRVVGKPYDSIECFEVEDPDFPDEVVPYFRASESGIVYDITEMGTGELSALYLIWILEFIKPWSIILIEEPEAMLPPSAHLALLDLICTKALQRNLAVIMATHSPDIITAMPEEQILPLHRFDGVSSHAVDHDRKHSALSNLGLRPAKRGLVLVEDELALIMANEIISRFDLHLFNSIEIRNIGSGFGQIKAILDAIPQFNSVKIIGLLDGDMESQAKKWKSHNLCCFLPFKVSAEIELLDAINSDKAGFSSESGRPISRIERGIQRARGTEGHDAFKDFCSEVGLSIEVCGSLALNRWIAAEGCAEACNITLRSMRNVLKMY